MTYLPKNFSGYIQDFVIRPFLAMSLKCITMQQYGVTTHYKVSVNLQKANLSTTKGKQSDSQRENKISHISMCNCIFYGSHQKGQQQFKNAFIYTFFVGAKKIVRKSVS